MSISLKMITYTIGTAIDLACVQYWPSITGDYEVLGYTSIEELTLMGLDFYAMHFENLEPLQDSFYRSLLTNNVPIYILKKVNRNPFVYGDITEGQDLVTEYLYIADTMIDKNKTIRLEKRYHITTLLNIGTYNKSVITDEFKDKLTNELIAILDSYSDKYRVGSYEQNIILQPDYEAKEEDRDFIEKQKRLEEERKAKIEAERKRLEVLAQREIDVQNQESVLIGTKNELNERLKKIEAKELEVQKLELEMVRKQESIRLRELELADQTAKLNLRAQRIYDRETQLGLPHTDL